MFYAAEMVMLFVTRDCSARSLIVLPCIAHFDPRRPDFQMSTTTPLSTTVSAVIETAVQFDDFDLLEVLGVGTWGKVFRVRNKQTGKISALKVIASELLTSEDEVKVMAELQALRKSWGFRASCS